MRLQRVVKRYGRAAPVLAGVDLEVPAGVLLQVVGGNGAGKSTLLQILAGVSGVSSGEVLGRPRICGYVPQSGGVHRGLSPHSYLSQLGRIRGLTARAARGRAEVLLDRLDVGTGRDAELATASGGTQRKAVIAQAFLVPAELLVLDEPFDGLDAVSAAVLTRMLLQAAADGAAVVLTDHRGQLPGAVVHELVGGRLTVGATGMVTVLLVHGSGMPAAEPVWGELPGVLTVTVTADQVRLLVSAAACDEVLSTALSRGWSIRSVNPETYLR
ncbi:ATP-binding cassette domain-containing protein [Nakamurella antarctica]|uniref:ATP-binding cassette domain-containing protein n=1 Tax=Nakamurella antarctica TaxID=1902245 RepID=UPI0013DDA4ED|nr:ABC transporter ATP-binding protein [Nakamurella antarctica]